MTRSTNLSLLYSPVIVLDKIYYKICSAMATLAITIATLNIIDKGNYPKHRIYYWLLRLEFIEDLVIISSEYFPS